MEIKEIEECKHKWKVIEVHIGFYSSWLNWFLGKNKVKVYILKCKKCGWIGRRAVSLPDLKWK